MSEKSKIKIIKRDEIVPKKRTKRQERNTSRNAAQEMVSTVGEWVTDLKKRKGEETKAAVDLLLGRTTLSNEA